jgi:ABC-type lipoprotein release transport system permease subunit
MNFKNVPAPLHSLFTVEQTDYSSNDEDYQLQAVKRNAHAIRDFKNAREHIQLAAVTRRGNAIVHIETPSETVQIAAVDQEGHAIRHIINKGIQPSDAVWLTAIKNNGHVICLHPKPTDDMQIAAINYFDTKRLM